MIISSDAVRATLKIFFRSTKKGEKWKYKSVVMPSATTLLRPPGKGWYPNLKRVKILNVAQQITEGNLKARNQA